MIAVEPRREASATFGRFAQAVRTALRHRDVLACETESRAWIIARETGRPGAQALGSRIVTAVPAEESWRGAPLTVSVGLAVLGEDGHNAATLIDAAEQMRFAAEASGIGIITVHAEESGAGDGEQPRGPGSGAGAGTGPGSGTGSGSGSGAGSGSGSSAGWEPPTTGPDPGLAG